MIEQEMRLFVRMATGLRVPMYRLEKVPLPVHVCHPMSGCSVWLEEGWMDFCPHLLPGLGALLQGPASTVV